MNDYYSVWKKPFPDKYDSEFVQLAFNRTERDINIRVNQGAIEEMKSSGLFTYIKSNKIKEARYKICIDKLEYSSNRQNS